MDDSADQPVTVSQAERVIQKLALSHQLGPSEPDPEVAPLFPGYSFGPRLVAGLTPIERGGPIDLYIDRPEGMTGWIINLTIKGRGQIFDGEGYTDVGPGDLLLFPPRIVHYYGRHPQAECWWHRWIFFHPRAFWMNWLAWRENRRGIFILRHLDRDIFGEIDKLFAEAASWSVQGDVMSVELATNLVERIVLLSAKQNRSAAIMHDLDERLMLAVTYLADNLTRPVSVTELARHSSLSPSRLAHLFSATFGKSIVRWRDEQRLQLASQLLQLSNRSIKQIAAEVGYDDPLYFSRIFRRRVGLSPKAFRARHQSPRIGNVLDALDLRHDPGGPPAAKE
jgi:AraC family transcriptional regulator, arabinose operon regulatory protein